MAIFGGGVVVVEKPHHRIVRAFDVLPATCEAPAVVHVHVGLPRAEPHVADGDVFEGRGLAVRPGRAKRVAETWFALRWERHLPEPSWDGANSSSSPPRPRPDRGQNCNRILRRWFPKGTDFSHVSTQRLHQVERPSRRSSHGALRRKDCFSHKGHRVHKGFVFLCVLCGFKIDLPARPISGRASSQRLFQPQRAQSSQRLCVLCGFKIDLPASPISGRASPKAAAGMDHGLARLPESNVVGAAADAPVTAASKPPSMVHFDMPAGLQPCVQPWHHVIFFGTRSSL